MVNNYYEYSKPIKMLSNSNKVVNWFFYTSILLIVLAFYIIFNIGKDIQQSYYYIIIYIHIPSAWLCILIYIIITITSILFLINKNPLINIITISGLTIGFIFTIITLITGALWGKPMWGTFWVWDARLTSVAVLALLYFINILINYLSISTINKYNIISIFIIIGLINIPIIKLSVEWWNTLHQSSSISQLNSSIHISMVIPLFCITISLILITLLNIFIEIRYLIVIHKKSNY